MWLSHSSGTQHVLFFIFLSVNILSTQLKFQKVRDHCLCHLYPHYIPPCLVQSTKSLSFVELPECPVFCLPSDVLRFDNTYSFIHAKKVSFTVEVLLPDKASEEKMKQLGAVTPK